MNRGRSFPRLGNGVVCAGTETDYQSTYHGTHIVSVATGGSHCTAKSATIHPIQVLDAGRKGSTLTVLCGLEKVIADAKAYNAASAPKRSRGS